jgi:hypothetical protein
MITFLCLLLISRYIPRLVFGLSMPMLEVDTGSVHVGILGSKVALVPVFLQVLLIYPVGIIPPMLHVDIALIRHKNRWSIIVTIYRFVK